MNDPLLMELNASDLEQEWMEDAIELRVADLEDMKLKDFTYHDMFPEENPNDFETILDQIIERSGGADADLEACIEEANEVYKQRTGVDRGK